MRTINNNNLMNSVEGIEIYSPDLHNAMLHGKISDNQLDNGVYLMVLRVLKKDSNIIIYSYIYYPKVFVDNLLFYLLSKSTFSTSYLFKEWGDFFTVIDNSLGNHELINSMKQIPIEYNLYFRDYLNTPKEYQKDDNYVYLYDRIKKQTVVKDINTIVSMIEFALNKQYYNFFNTISSEFSYIDSYIPLEHDMYILKDCLFVVRNKDEFLSKLRELKTNIDGKTVNYVVNKGPKSFRDQLNSMTSFLACLDDDYRNNLYKHHLDRVNKGIIPFSAKMPRSKFSYKNIHMRLGNVRYYSTSKCNNINISTSLDNKTIHSRRQLFETNYNIVDKILDKYSYIGSKEVQEEIELALRSQEQFYSENNPYSQHIKFNSKTFELIDSKNRQLEKLLSYPIKIEGNSKYHSTKYLPLVKEISEELGSNVISGLLISFFMDIVTKETISLEEKETRGISTITAFNIFGKKIIDRYLYSKYLKSEIKKNGGSLSEYKLFIKNELKDVNNDEGMYAIVGGNFVWNLLTVGLLTEVLDRDPENSKQTVHYLRLVQEIRKIIITNNKTVYHVPQKLPMVCEPKNYVLSPNIKKNKLGGYLLNDVYYTDSLIKDRIGFAEKTTIKEQNMIIDMVNGLSKTPYKINVDTLIYIYKYGIEKKIILDDNTEDFKEFKKNPYSYSKKDYQKYKSLESKILMERNIISIAEIFSKVEKIYFPVRLDVRTRIYCRTDFFDYQKNDLAKGLISFANPGIISKFDSEAIKYFKAFGANMYGHSLDKKSLNYRVKWIDDNTTKILNFESNDIVDKSENKVCFISFCFEYKRFIDFINNKDSTLFYTYLPIQLDATCNGYQHLALLTKETKLLSKLNLDKSTHDDDPNDFYTYILENTRDFIKAEVIKLEKENNLTERQVKELESFKVLEKIDLGRSIIKKVTMRESYSAGISSLVNTVLSDLQGHGRDNKEYYTYLDSKVKITRMDIVVYIKTLKTVAAILAPKIRDLSKYLNSIVSICTKLKIPIPWSLPHGAEIPQSYLVEVDRKIRAFGSSRSKYTFKSYLPGIYDLKKQMRAIRPNLIHSLDATTIAMLYNDLKDIKGIDLYTVHDCFAVSANNVPLLLKKLKNVYLKLYSTNSYLTTFDHSVRFTINNIFGDQVFKINDKYIYIPDGKGNKIKKVPFPDVTKIINLETKINMDNINNSSYPLV